MKRIIFLIAVLVVIAGCGQKVVVTNFDECAAAGYPVMESHPRQCSDGSETFVEALGELSRTEAEAIAMNSACHELGTLTQDYIYN